MISMPSYFLFTSSCGGQVTILINSHKFYVIYGTGSASFVALVRLCCPCFSQLFTWLMRKKGGR